MPAYINYQKEIIVHLLTTRTGNKKIAVYLPKIQRYINDIKTLEGRRWNPTEVRWEIPIANLKKLKQLFPDAQYSEGIAEFENIQKEKDQLIIKEYKEIASQIDLSKPLPNGMTLFDHQVTGIKRMLQFRRIILADEMGLGKTLQALVTVKILSEQLGYYVIIVCPASLTEKPWNKLAQSIKISGLKYSIYSWAKMPSPPPKNYIVVADEAHYSQSGTKTKRGKAFLELSEHDNCRGVYCLTGTPMKNGRPINIFPLLQAVRHPLSEDSKFFQTRYCDAHLRKIPRKNKKAVQFWDASGATRLEELNEKIKDTLIRRTKKECLDLPDKLRVLREAELSTASKEIYDTTLNRLRRTYQERLDKEEIQEGGEAMIMLGHLSHAGALGKIETAYELAEEVIEEGNQVVLFSSFVEPLTKLYEKFKANHITTEMLIGDTKHRDKLVENFLAGKSKVFLLSMAGGVGIDLFTASTIILINRPYTPGDCMQIEDRLHRIGQKNPVTSIWLQYGDADKHIDDILYSKSVNIGSALGDKTPEAVISFVKKYFKKK